MKSATSYGDHTLLLLECQREEFPGMSTRALSIWLPNVLIITSGLPFWRCHIIAESHKDRQNIRHGALRQANPLQPERGFLTRPLFDTMYTTKLALSRL